MPRLFNAHCGQLLVASFLSMNLMAGFVISQETQANKSKTPKSTDDKYDFSLTVSPEWKSAPLQGYTVPGVARMAFTGDKGASIVVFIQEPGKDYTPRFLVDESAKGMEKGLGAEVKLKEVRTVAGKQAMWMVVQGKGTGGAIDGKGTILTSQHWVAVPREKDIVIVLLTSPTSDFTRNAKSFEEVLKTLVVGGKQSAEQSDSK